LTELFAQRVFPAAENDFIPIIRPNRQSSGFSSVNKMQENLFTSALKQSYGACAL
jgi:hypothetical protein